jgi:hypothetical protein
MNTSSALYLAFGASAMAVCWLLALSGFSFTNNRPEVVPVSVRDNPASFRPSYTVYTGWHPVPVPSSSGGGFGFGK